MKTTIIPLVFSILILFLPPAGLAQDSDTLSLSLSRDWGYSSGRGDIQGNFSMKAKGPDDLAWVEFYIDETRIGEDRQTPFRLSFTTDAYPTGLHTLWARGYTADGRELRSNEIRANFVSAEVSQEAVQKMLVPMLSLVFGIILVSFALSFFPGRGLKTLPPGAPRKYGISGGAICPRCQRPFPLRLLGMNLVAGKLDRCPFCGKWAVHRPRSREELRAAETAEIERAQAESARPEESAEDKLRKQLDASRFQSD